MPQRLVAPPSAARLLRRAALLGALAVGPMAAIAGDSQGQGPATSASNRSVAQVVAGIVSYTRWPGHASDVRLCTQGQSGGIDELRRAPEIEAGPHRIRVRSVDGHGPDWSSCDVVYLGTMSIDETRSLLHALLGRPVLVVGEGAGFCAEGGMFCLETRPASVRFQANLDAIARSGLRVNPQVLRLARQNAGAGS